MNELLDVSCRAATHEYLWMRCECGRKLFRFMGLPHRGAVIVEIKCPSCGRISEYTVRFPYLT